MFISIATTHRPAVDLGFLLMKHPERVHEVELAFGKAIVFFPQADEQRCEAALVLDVDPGRIGAQSRAGARRPICERPALCGVVLALGGAQQGVSHRHVGGFARAAATCDDAAPAGNHCRAAAPARIRRIWLERLFEPLGWQVEIERIAGQDRPSRYVELTLRGMLRVADALSHLYVLIPTFDATSIIGSATMRSKN